MLNDNLNVAVIGAGGALGGEFVQQLSLNKQVRTVHAFSSSDLAVYGQNVSVNLIDIEDEESIQKAAEIASNDVPVDLVIVAIGMLHGENVAPEKSLRDLSREKFQKIFSINIIAPAIIAKYFVPKLNKGGVIAFLSARVGSISDNYLGGWYAYRSSKAALNMLIKNLAIELSRSRKNAIAIGLHPGTVDSKLSKPFQSAVKEGGLFSAEYSVKKLLQVIFAATLNDSGRVIDYNNIKIDW